MLVVTLYLSYNCEDIYASKTTENKKVHQLYQNKIKNLAKKSSLGEATYHYADLTGDGIDELMVMYKPNTGGSGTAFDIYTVRKGKISQIGACGDYGLSKVYYYRKTKSILIYGFGHGGESINYYKQKKGKFVYVADQARTSYAGGGSKEGTWAYYEQTPEMVKQLTKKQFNKKISGIKKGKRIVWNVYEWKCYRVG